MQMQVVRDRPPLFDQIDAKFSIRGKPILLAWGNLIYVPSGSLDISGALHVHERIHGDRQLAYAPPGATRLALVPEERIELWWKRYLVDIDFRREEEILAHREEYRYLCEHAGGRNQRRRHLSIVAAKLSHPLYGPMMNKATARKVLEDVDTSRP